MAAVVVGVVEVDELLPYQQLIKAEIVYTDETYAIYEIYLDGYSPSDSLKATVYNDFTYREINLFNRDGDNNYYADYQDFSERWSEHGFQGEISDLTPHMSYTFEVLDGNKSIGKCSFKTERKEEYHEPQEPTTDPKEIAETYEPTVEFNGLWDYSASFVVSMNGYSPKNELSCVVYNAERSYSVDISRQMTEYGQLSESEKRTYSFEAIASDLLAASTYTLEIWDGNDKLTSSEFTTTDTQPQSQIYPTAEITEVGMEEAAFIVYMNGYNIENELICIAYDESGDEREVDISENIAMYSDLTDEEREQYSFDGIITDLMSGITYTFEIKDGNKTVYSMGFETTDNDESA